MYCAGSPGQDLLLKWTLDMSETQKPWSGRETSGDCRRGGEKDPELGFEKFEMLVSHSDEDVK